MSDRKGTAIALALTLALGAGSAMAQTAQTTQTAQAQKGGIRVVSSPSESPLVAVRLMFDVGSIHDPKGKEGLAALTASMVGEAGTKKRSYTDLLEAL